MAVCTLTSKGQITLPKAVREHLHLASGDRVDFVVEASGTVRLQPVGRSVEDLDGFLHRPERSAPSLETIDRGLAEELAADDERIRRGG